MGYDRKKAVMSPVVAEEVAVVDQIRVLVVDDAAFMRDVVKKSLRPTFPGFKLEEAAHGRQAQNMLQKQAYDLVLCDWEMPEMNGAELLGWMRENEATRDVPFIMVTSRGEKEHVMKAIELKANNYIVKPYTTERLVKVVTMVLGKSKKMSLEQLRRVGVKGALADTPGGLGLSGAVPIAARLDSVEPAPAPAARPSSVKVSGKVVAQLRFHDDAVPCLLKEVGRERVQGVIRRDAKLPNILDLAVLDLQHGEEVARLNGYVHTLQARDDNRETEFVNITIGLVDQDDAEKMAFLGRFMATLS